MSNWTRFTIRVIWWWKACRDPVADLDPIIAEYHIVLDNLADELYAKGVISERYAEFDFNERYLRICEESQNVHKHYFDFSLPKGGVQPDTPLWVGPAVLQHAAQRESAGRG